MNLGQVVGGVLMDDLANLQLMSWQFVIVVVKTETLVALDNREIFRTAEPLNSLGVWEKCRRCMEGRTSTRLYNIGFLDSGNLQDQRFLFDVNSQQGVPQQALVSQR